MKRLISALALAGILTISGTVHAEGAGEDADIPLIPPEVVERLATELAELNQSIIEKQRRWWDSLSPLSKALQCKRAAELIEAHHAVMGITATCPSFDTRDNAGPQ